MGFNAGVLQEILSDAAQSSTIGFIEMYRNTNTNTLTLSYTNGAAIAYAVHQTFFTGYDNTWVHFTIVADYSGASTEFYRNGSLIQTTAMTGTPVFPSINRVKYLGAYSPANVAKITNGNLDDIRIYNRELSAAEIKALYEGTK
jgi:hypothetical protein